MNLFDLQCKCCGGELSEVEGKSRVAKCIFCGKMQTIPVLSDERRANQFNRAEQLRRNNDYDKAISLYERLIEENPNDPDAYWSMVLCRYGIEYVKDPKSGEQKPTVNRAQYTSILADEDYKSAIKYADADQKQLYEAEARQINEIQKGILEIASREEPFDIFICYKESDEHGKRTKDSILAQELYHELTRDGYKVFFARVTLDDKLGSAYEPYIFSALNSAKVMVVLGTKPEYFNAVWVRNEWSRFMGLIKNGEKKALIPAYKDMDAYDLPEEFAHLQALNMDKLGFMADLVMGIEKMLAFYRKDEKKEEKVPEAPRVIVEPPQATAPVKKKKSKAPIVIIALLLVAAIAAGSFVLYERMDFVSEYPEETTTDKALNNVGDPQDKETEPGYVVLPGGDDTDELPGGEESDGGEPDDALPEDGRPEESSEANDDNSGNGGNNDIFEPAIEYFVDEQGVKYSKAADGDYYYVSGFVEGSVTVVKISEEINGLPVYSIAAEAFKGCTTLMSVIIADGVTSIGKDAFSGCVSLASITVPKTVKVIGDNVFANCEALSKINYGGSRDTWIEINVGIGNDVLGEVEVHFGEEDVCTHKEIERDGCRNLCAECGEYLGTEHSEEYIDENEGCVKRCGVCNEIVDRNSHHEMIIDTNDNCNYKCSRCGYVEQTGQHQGLYEERVEPTADADGYIKKYCLDCGYVMSNQVLPATGTSVNPDLVVENAVTSIEEGVAYYGVLAQQNLNKLLYLDGKMFNDWYLNTTEDIEDAAPLYFESYGSGLYYMYFLIDGNRQYVNVYQTVDGKTDIDLTSNPNDNCTWQFSEAFGCLVGLADEVMFLGTINNGYYNNVCTKTSDYISDYFVLQLVKKDGGEVGKDPVVESDGTFNYTLNGDERSYSVSAAEGFAEKSLVIPDEYNGLPVTAIADEGFKGVMTITGLTIPYSVTTIGNNAFNACRGIAVLNIPESVTEIGDYAFANCYKLSEVIIPTSVLVIGEYAFYNCGYLTTIQYLGSAAEWKNISVGEGNDVFDLVEINFEGGAGSDDPGAGATEVKSVSSANELTALINQINNGTVSKYVTIELTQSIDMKSATWTPIYDFRGVFDGKDYTISNFVLTDNGTTITVSDGNWVEYGIKAIGFINSSYGATIKNLTLDGVTANFTTASNVFVGALAGFADGLTVQDCTVKSNLAVNVSHSGTTISGAAGLVGYSLDASAIRVNIDTVVNYTANSDEAFVAAILGAGNIRFDYGKVQLEVTYTRNGGAGHTGSLIGMERTPDDVTLSCVTNSSIAGKVSYNSSMYAMGVIGQGAESTIRKIDSESNNTINVTYN